MPGFGGRDGGRRFGGGNRFGNRDGGRFGGRDGGRRFGGGFRRDFGPREMHKAVCAECKKECEVPFKPNGEKPVYCRDCFLKRKDSGQGFAHRPMDKRPHKSEDKKSDDKKSEDFKKSEESEEFEESEESEEMDDSEEESEDFKN